jgi:hypothetical protein
MTFCLTAPVANEACVSGLSSGLPFAGGCEYQLLVPPTLPSFQLPLRTPCHQALPAKAGAEMAHKKSAAPAARAAAPIPLAIMT